MLIAYIELRHSGFGNENPSLPNVIQYVAIGRLEFKILYLLHFVAIQKHLMFHKFSGQLEIIESLIVWSSWTIL